MMRLREEGTGKGLDLRAFYSIASLARHANVNRFMLGRLLRKNGVHFIRNGRCLLVPLSEIEQKIPPLWQSLCAAEKARRLEPGS